MSEKELTMEMANLICRFGSEFVLLDMLEPIVFPAFFGESKIRVYGETSFFFFDVKLVRLKSYENNLRLGIAGRFIKDTKVQRDQIFEEGKGIIKDSRTLRSSPSALFLLLLNNHRLIYVKETRDAPPKDTFRTTLHYFLMERHKSFLRKAFEDYKLRRKREPETPVMRKIDFLELFPPPSLKLIPLTSEDSIQEFINKYELLRSIEISISDRNSEIDNDSFFEELNRRKELLGSKKSAVKHSSRNGLDKEIAKNEVREATSQGNQVVNLDGYDTEGNKLQGNNEKFQLRRSIEVSEKMDEAISQLDQSFMDLVKAGVVKVPEEREKDKEILRSIYRGHYDKSR